MTKMLERMPAKAYEALGTAFGLLASVSIAAQVYAEITSKQPSTVSVLYIVGFLIIFLFWTLYGLRFGRPALWVTNGIATAVQTVLLVVVLSK